MTSLIAKLWARLCPKRAPLSIMIIGLDNSGKTSILNSLVSSNNQQRCQPVNHEQSTASSAGRKSPSIASQQQSTQTSTTSRHSIRRGINNEEQDISGRVGDDSFNSNTVTSKDNDRSSSPAAAAAGSSVVSRRNSVNKQITPTIGYNYERVQYKNLTITVLDFSGQNRYRNLWQEFYNGVDGIVFVVDSSDLIRLVVARDELETMLSHQYFSTLTIDTATTGAHDKPPSEQMMIDGNKTRNDIFSPQKQISISQGRLIQSPLDTAALLPLSTSRQSSIFNPLGGATSAKVTGPVASARNHNTKAATAAAASPRRRTKIPILFLANKSDLANSVESEVIIKALNLNQLPVERHPWFIQATSVTLSQGIVEGFDWLVSQVLAN